MKYGRLLMAAILGLLSTTASSAEVIDFGGLLAQMLDRSRIAEFPEPAFVCKQASSYNRKSQQPGTPEWFSTDDYSNFVPCEQVGDRREWVMLDVDEPGAIVRWWITQYKYDGTEAVRTIAGGKQVLPPGQSITRDIADGGAICRLRVKIDADDIEQAMRSTVTRADFDGKQRVWAPVGGFFGSGPGLNPFKGWWRQVEKDRWITCWWPMPFRETATISVTNHGTSDVTVELGEIAVAEWTWTDRTMYFHSSWRGDDHIAVFGNNYVLGEEWNYITVRGKGVYVGETMAVFNRPLISKNSWWGEGDEKIYVDGELFPSHCRRFLFGSGCNTSPDTPDENLVAFRDAARHHHFNSPSGRRR